MADQIQEVTKEANVSGTTTLSIQAPTPKWATNLFRIFYHLSTAAIVWLGVTHLVPEANKFEILAAFSIADRVMWAFARCIGVKKTDVSEDLG